MKAIFFIVAGIVLNCSLWAQISIPPEYYEQTKKADSLLAIRDFKNAGLTYCDAFNTIGGKGIPIDRYNAARAWAQCSFPDSAFLNLERIVSKTMYANYYHISNDIDLIPLHSDKRWQPLMEAVKQNKLNSEAGFPTPDKNQLDSIYVSDQKYRGMLDSVVATYGYNSPQMDTLNALMLETDKINLIRVNMIFEKYGWLGPEEVSRQANSAMFLVIQHANDIQTQEDFLPILRKAVKEGKAIGADVALL